jgi:hypothetical protein
MAEATDCLFTASAVIPLFPLAEDWKPKIPIFHITAHEQPFQMKKTQLTPVFFGFFFNLFF